MNEQSEKASKQKTSKKRGDDNYLPLLSLKFTFRTTVIKGGAILLRGFWKNGI